MKIVEVNDRIGPRDLYHRNLLVVPGKGILEFTGEDFPPALQVLGVEYTKIGKWSHSTWECRVADDHELVAFYQNWGRGVYFPDKTWERAVKEIRYNLPGGIGNTLTDDQIVQAIWEIFPKEAFAIDEAERAFDAAGDLISELLAAQQAIAEDRKAEAAILARVAQLEEAERLKDEAAAIASRVSKANELLSSGKKFNLGDLKAAITGSAA